MTISANTHSEFPLPHPSAKCFYSCICLVALFSVPFKLLLSRWKGIISMSGTYLAFSCSRLGGISFARHSEPQPHLLSCYPKARPLACSPHCWSILSFFFQNDCPFHPYYFPSLCTFPNIYPFALWILQQPPSQAPRFQVLPHRNYLYWAPSLLSPIVLIICVSQFSTELHSFTLVLIAVCKAHFHNVL